MKTTIQRQKLLAKYHIICQQINMSEDDRRAYLEGNYGVYSSRELTNKQLIEAINTLQQVMQSNSNIWRRRVMAAIGAYLRRLNLAENAETIKAIACRAAEVNNFNKISLSKLRAIYNEFSKQNQAGNECIKLKSTIENELSKLN